MTTIQKQVNEVEGKTAIVTGAGSGIGRAIAELLYIRGAKVIAVDVDNSVHEIEREGITLLIGDVTKEETSRKAVSLAIEHYGKLDILVNNAGVFFTSQLLK